MSPLTSTQIQASSSPKSPQKMGYKMGYDYF